jgi:glutathione S-transferase
MAKATLTIASKNYGSWSLRGWLLCKSQDSILKKKS